MKKAELSADYISGFCGELALLLQAGVTIDDGISSIGEDYKDKSGFLTSLHESTENGASLHDALSKTERVPQYMLEMIMLGELSGRLEKTLFSLAEYYDKRARMTGEIRIAIIYPLVLIIMLAAVVTVLVTRVLPIFADVFSQIGTQMSPFAQTLMVFGQKLSAASAWIVWILAALCASGILISLIPAARKGVYGFLRSSFGGRGIFLRAATAQFAGAMTTAMASGLDPEQSVELAGKVIGGIKKTDEGLKKCKALMEQGISLEKSLAAAGIFSSRDSRLLSLGIKTGKADFVMEQIAKRSEEKAVESIDASMAKIEPTLVVIISLIVGSVLLSVMLPLMGIMSSIG